MAELARAPALDAEPIARAGVTIRAIDPAGQVILRGDGAAILPALRAILDLDLPIAPCTRAGTGDIAAWLAPDRWLVVSADRAGAALAAAFVARLAPSVADAHDVSDGLVAVEVAGADAVEVLTGACNLDLHPRAFPAMACARTIIGGVDAVIYRWNGGFRLHVARPVAHHLWSWLAAAAGDLED